MKQLEGGFVILQTYWGMAEA